jgi:hypothetical protein
MVMEATQGGFRLVPFTRYEKSLVALVEPRFSIDYGLTKAVDWLGEGYDYAGLFGMAWVEFGRWLGRKWRNPWRDSKTMFCSEAVARVLVESNYPGTSCWDPQSVDPERLLKLFEEEAAAVIAAANQRQFVG